MSGSLDRETHMTNNTPTADGPLPLALIGLTVVAGTVDAVSYLGLGHVFVANMTGNVVFLGFVAGGAVEFSVALSLHPIPAFSLGAVPGGRLAPDSGGHRGRPPAGLSR